MNILLDTHILFWLLTGSDRMPGKAIEYITSEKNTIWFSVVSAWEISTKHLTHPEHMPYSGSDLINACKQMQMKILNVTSGHVKALDSLTRGPGEPSHNDPFDRMLLAQAKDEGFYLLTHDHLISGYHEECAIIV